MSRLSTAETEALRLSARCTELEVGIESAKKEASEVLEMHEGYKSKAKMVLAEKDKLVASLRQKKMKKSSPSGGARRESGLGDVVGVQQGNGDDDVEDEEAEIQQAL